MYQQKSPSHLLTDRAAEIYNHGTEAALDLIFPQDEQKTPHKEAVVYEQKVHFHVLFDGGSRGNGTAGQQGYGSFLIHNGKKHRRYTREFGQVTNNVAEYSALIEALLHLIAAIHRARKNAGHYHIRVVGDSQLVIKQVTGEWKCKADHLKPLHQQVIKLASLFASVRYDHTGRETCIQWLGH